MTEDEAKKAATRAKLKAFLQGGHPDDVSSVLVHTLMQHAENRAEARAENAANKSNKTNKKKKKN